MYYYRNSKVHHYKNELTCTSTIRCNSKIIDIDNSRIIEHLNDLAQTSDMPLNIDNEFVEILSVLELNEYIPIEVYSVISQIIDTLSKASNDDAESNLSHKLSNIK